MNDQKPEEVKVEVIGAPEDKPGGLAITSMVLGIAGVVCSWVIVLNFALGLAALITGIIEFKKISAGTSSMKGRGMAIAGIVLGSVTIFASIIYVIVIAVTAVSAYTWMPFWTDTIQSYMY